MDSNRWKQVDSLLQSALERPAEERDAFLRQACVGDPSLEFEVRSLLASQQQAGSFLESPVLEVASRVIAATETGTQLDWAGQTVSHYKILSMLGAGGMGVVYKAVDTRLDRPVALKFLPPHLSHNSELKLRLTEEARAASALDHPNIVVIHDIGETANGDLFIAMAFHEGATLQQRIKQDNTGTGLPISTALQITRQIAAGLARAHERGIFHRDIKPSNIIVTEDNVARIIDFGLAKSNESTVTLDGSTKGTPRYMSPEQASGQPVDFHTDLWSLGAVLYEMLGGRPPFAGDSQLQVMHAIVHDTPPRLRDVRPELPAEIELIVTRALQKDPAKRYQSAAEMERDLSTALAVLAEPAAPRSALRAAYAIPALLLILLLAAAAVWFYQRSEKRHWAREQAIPEIARLKSENKPVAAYLLEQKAQQYLPGDPQLAQITEGLTHLAIVHSSPPGAMVEIKDYLSPGDAWFTLGTTPLENVKIPTGYLRWRLSKPGMEDYLGAPISSDMHGPLHEFNFLLETTAKIPPGMAPVPSGKFEDYIWSIGPIGPWNLPEFYIDRFEVSNRQYQEFIEKGGYQKREYWKEKFIRDGQELSWEQAMDVFRDSSGRPGPSTWDAGHYAAGQSEYPVSGVSWYEAAAYAEFAGKRLPVIAQWYLAAPSSVAKYILQQSNYSLTALAPVGKYQGLGPWGTYDMAGNVSEWCWNGDGRNSRYSLGGAWKTSSSDYYEPLTLPPFDRSANNGFRCVRNLAALPLEATAEKRIVIRDFSKAKPVSDDVFRIYKGMYAYDRTPLNAKLEPVEQDSKDWHKEKITFDAAYGNDRVTAYLFLPANVRTPYQTIVFFPTARSLDSLNSKTLEDMNIIDFVIKSGRAVMYPVYKDMYERRREGVIPTPSISRDILIQRSKDLGRSIDYLETRPDIDRRKIGYMGISMGASWGVILAGVEDRLKCVIFLDGGFYDDAPLPGTDQVDFTPRIKAPTLMIGGKYDWIFQGKDVMFKMLGTPAADKRAVTFNTSHDVSEQRADMIREVLAWLDKTFGRVN